MREGIKPHPELSRFYLRSRSRVFHANCLLLLSHHGESDETRTRDLRRDRPVALLIKSTTYPGTPVISIPVEPFQSVSSPFQSQKLGTKWGQKQEAIDRSCWVRIQA